MAQLDVSPAAGKCWLSEAQHEFVAELEIANAAES
jgi:hypothetical protein